MSNKNFLRLLIERWKYLLPERCLTYPIEGYRPLQTPRLVEVAQAELLFTYLHNLLPKVVEDDQVSLKAGQKKNCPVFFFFIYL